MAYADAIVQQMSSAGTTVTFASAPAGGLTIPAFSGLEILHVKNGGASPITVTIKAQNPCSQGTLHDITRSVSASSEAEFPEINPYNYRASDGKVYVDFSGVTSVTYAVKRP